MTRQLLLTYDFPPIGGGIARMMGELAMRYPPGSLVVSTGRCPGSAAVDTAMTNRVHRASIDSRSTRLGNRGSTAAAPATRPVETRREPAG